MKNSHKITIEDILNRTVFKVLLILATMLTAVPYINEKVLIIMSIVFVYGFAVLILELVRGKLLAMLKETKEAWFLYGFIIAYFFTLLINKTTIPKSYAVLTFMLLTFLLLFIFPKDIKKDKVLKEIKIVSITTIICTFVLNFISFILYMFSISGVYYTSNGMHKAYYGMDGARLWGLYNPNNGATLTVISILLSIAFLIKQKKKRIIVPLSINILLQFSVMLLTGSRAGYYVLAGTLAFCAFFFVWYKMKEVTVKTIVVSGLSIVLVLGGYFTVGTGLRECLAYVPGITEYVLSEPKELTENGPESEKEGIDKVDLERNDLAQTPDKGAFANRIDIWKISFEEFLKAPVFGIGKENFVEFAGDRLGEELKLHFRFGSTHNIYLCVLVSSGIVGFLLLAAFVVITISHSVKTIVKEYRCINWWLLMSFVMCMMMYTTEFVEARMLYKISVFSAVFWTYCGYMYKLSKIERKENSEQFTLNTKN